MTFDFEIMNNRIRRSINWSKLYHSCRTKDDVERVFKRDKEFAVEYQNIFFKYFGTQDYVI